MNVPRRALRRGAAAVIVATAALLAPLTAPVPVSAATPGASAPGHHHLDAWWYDLMHLDRVHRSVDGSGVRIAVIDTAIDTSVPELRGADVHVHPSACRLAPRGPLHDTVVVDHGTSMTSVLVGTGHGNAPGGLGIEGVAPGARVDFYSLTQDPKYQGFECDNAEIASTLVKAARDGADIISMSFGGPGVDVSSAVHTLQRMGVVLVAATGSRSQGEAMGLPGGIRGVVGVNAGTRDGKAWNGNPVPTRRWLRIGGGYPAATSFGVDVTVPRYLPGRGWVSDSTGTGTSPATAIVAGQLALVKSRWPDATGNQLIQQLVHYSADDVSFRWDKYFGYGYPSTTKMLAHDPTLWPDENPLLLTPAQSRKRYPMSVRTAAAAGASAAATAATSAAPAPAPAAGGQRPAAQTGGSAQAGVPVVAWALPLALLVTGAGGFLLVRRGRPRAATRRAGEQRQGA